MGKKRKLNKFITKWIKSDLPEDRSSVLLLGVTRIPTSPAPARRPSSLPLTNPHHAAVANSTSNPDPPSGSGRRNSKTRAVCGNSFSSRCRTPIVRRNSSSRRSRRNRLETPQSARSGFASASSSDGESQSATPCNNCCNCNCEGQFSSDSDCCCVTGCEGCAPASSADDSLRPLPRLCDSHGSSATNEAVMDRSVDSIGTCSLDVEASAEISDCSEVSSGGTLRSVNLNTPTPEPHLPSYLSLACTVNGYSTTTNYDPERLARSRDASPHRPFNHDPHLNQSIPTYSISNNLLSPPNLVPLPTPKSTPLNTRAQARNNKNMTDQTLTTHIQEYYKSSKSVTFVNRESKKFAMSMFASDSVDSGIENGVRNGIQTKRISYESSTTVTTNGQSKCTSQSSLQECNNERESKSFIQQRVERLYGPGALAQGFFVKKRQQNRSFNIINDKNYLSASPGKDKHSKSMCDDLLKDENLESGIKQSTSSPTLPVLRHLRPEFRAQLPIMSPRKGDSTMQKSSTVPVLNNDAKVNGHNRISEEMSVPVNGSAKLNDISEINAGEESGEKNGHYFIALLTKETSRLLALADTVEDELNDEKVPEEMKGKLRSASGKARLLVSQKMQQFKGLCTNNITQVEGDQFPTTNEDLQGFWDMVMLQVDQVDALFKEIDNLRKNNWQEMSEDVVDKSSTNNSNGIPGKLRKLRIRPVSAANEEARKQREAQRKQIIEDRRKAMRAQKQRQENIEIFVPESS